MKKIILALIFSVLAASLMPSCVHPPNDKWKYSEYKPSKRKYLPNNGDKRRTVRMW